jgi:hypothetical protein
LSRFTLHSRSVLLTLALACGLSGAFAKDKEKKVTPPPPPPQPIPQKLKVLRNTALDISLRIYGRKNQSITYLVRRQPAGDLTSPKNTELEVAVVQYRAPTDRKVTTDSFEYASKSDRGVSAPALVEIEIIDIPAELISPVELVFPPILTGTVDKQTVDIENQGGNVAEGDIFVTAPWRIEVSSHYRIEPGQKRSVAITFAPDKPGDFTSELRFSSQPDRITTLRGKALSALEAKPDSLSLEPVTGSLTRAAALGITNHTAEPQTVRMTGPERIVAEPPLTLGPGQSGTVMIQTKGDDVRPLSAELVLESGNHRTIVTVRAEALPGILQAENTRVELRPTAPGGAHVGTFIVRNFGGEPASADLVCDAEFQLSTNRLTLPVAGEGRVDVSLISGVNPPIEGTVQVKSGNFTQRIALAAMATPHTAGSAKKAANSRPSTRKSDRNPTPVPYPDQWSPYETDPTAPIDPVNIIRTVAMSSTSCTLEWHVDRSSSTKFIAETRELKIEEGQLVKHWHKHGAFRVEQAGNHFRGTIESLQPSRMYTVRVRGLDDKGEAGATILEASITTRPPVSKSTPAKWIGTILVCGAAILGFAWWRRLHSSSASNFDPKKTQKFV